MSANIIVEKRPCQDPKTALRREDIRLNLGGTRP